MDENVTADPRSVCGVRSTANPGCRASDVSVECVEGNWQCAFDDPAICGGAAADCGAVADDTCDNKDNDCNGTVDDAFAAQKGMPCSKTYEQCEEIGIQDCDTATGALVCDATEPVPGPEQCNGKDDDCDGYVDESYSDMDKGADDGSYVRPELVALSETGPWVFAYEASRPDATASSQGSGNGYFDVAPSGEGRDATVACSKPDRMPWTNVSPWEMEQTCEAIGGRICRLGDWQSLCSGSSGACTLGFLGCQAASDYDSGPFCNLGAFQLEGGSATGTLLATASTELSDCASSWDGVFDNVLDAFDTTGNAREAVRCQKNRAACTDCAVDCCSGTWSTVTGPAGDRTVCGSDMSYARRVLSGQPCSADSQCCYNDINCAVRIDGSYPTGVCLNGICAPRGAASSCVGRGVVCNDTDGDGSCNSGSYDVPCCSDAPRSGGVCGGSTSLPHATYPVLGGSYQTASEDSATCDYSFFKVAYDFRLFDTGFRCCFDTDPR